MDKKVFDRLKLAREMMGYSQTDVAKHLNLKGASAVSKWEKGHREIRLSIMDNLANFLNVSKSWLVNGDINENYNYEITTTIQLNRFDIKEIVSRLDVPLLFFNAILAMQISPSVDFYNRIMEVLGVKPQGNLKDRVEEFGTKHINNNNQDFVTLNVVIKDLRIQLSEYMEALGEAQMEIRKLKSDIEQLKREKGKF